MLKYLQVMMLVVNFVRENPEFVAKFREIINAIKDHFSGENVSALSQEAFMESLADQACGVAAAGEVTANAVALERRQWLDLIRLIFENWDKIAPIFFKD